LPEGHTVHRTAMAFERKFLNQPLTVISPQGRFSAGAQLISGTRLRSSNAIGKQLFLNFENSRILRIHLGIYGKWNWHSNVAVGLAEPIGQVRARFIGASDAADLRGPTVCEVITPEEAQAVALRLGPDPLNPDPVGSEKNRFIERVRKSKSPIGQLLMDQSVISGIGNVYRAELLFRAGIDPYRPGGSVTVDELNALWNDSVKLLQVGVKTGFMITRDELFTKRPTKAERNFIYKREGLPCRSCGTNISIALMATRKLYYCPFCQS